MVWFEVGHGNHTGKKNGILVEIVLSCLPIEMQIQAGEIDWTSMLQDLDSFDEQNLHTSSHSDTSPGTSL